MLEGSRRLAQKREQLRVQERFVSIQGEGVLVALDALAAVVPVGTAQVASRS